jgi:hypothetical protein
MSRQIIKLSSRQNQPVTSTKNLVDFNIPDGQYDLSRCYLNVNVSLPSEYQANISLLGLTKGNVSAVEQPQGTYDDNVSLVRHASLKHGMGMIENNRHINVLKHNTSTYEESNARKYSSSITDKLSCPSDVNSLGLSHYRTIEKKGTTKSVDKAHNHIIHLQDVLNFCKASYFEANSLELHLEMDVENLTVFQKLKADDAYWTQTYGGAAYTNGAMVDATAGGAVTEITTQRPYGADLEASPFYVGQLIDISGTALAAPQEREILGIDTNSSNQLILTIASVTLTGAGTVLAKSVNETTSNSPVFNYVELVMTRLQDKQPKTSYEYSSYHLQEDTISSASLNKNYMLNPMTKNVFIVTPSSGNTLNSNVSVTDYRFAIDNVSETNRPIKFDTRDPLHLSQVIKTYNNRDDPLQNFSGLQISPSNTQTNPSSNSASYMIMTPTPITPGPKMLNVDMNTDSAMGRLFLFEEVVKKL